MKRKISQLIGSTLLCSILAINMLATPNISFAAQESNPEGIEYLKNDTLYQYDLNGDDKVDEIKVKELTSDEGITTLKLYINSKLCLTRKSDAGGFGVQVCDLDKNDNYLDLFIAVYPGNDYVMNAFFTRYNGKTLDTKVTFAFKDIINKDRNGGSYKIVKLAGNGKFYINDYTDCDTIGSFHCYMPFQLKDSAITFVPEKTYKLLTITDKYKAAKSFQAYEKAGSKKVVYTVKKGNEVTFDKLYISKSGKAYLRMTNSKGKTGWIRCDQKGLFTNANIVG